MTREELNQTKQETLTKQAHREARKKLVIFSMKTIFFLVVFFSLFLFYNYYISTTRIEVKERRVISEKIPDNFNGLKIIQFSDIHYGNNIFDEELERLVKVINSRKPDLVIFSGDLIDPKFKLTKKEKKRVITTLSKIKSSIGKYAISGDEDKDISMEILRTCDFNILNNNYDLVYNSTNNPILLIGIDSYLNKKVDFDKAFAYFEIPEHNSNIYTIVMVHEPDCYDEFKDHKVDLVLAGHSHNGYIRLPKLGAITKKEKGAQKYRDFEYKFDDTYFFISNGIGTNGNGIRLFNHPSVSLLRLSNY